MKARLMMALILFQFATVLAMAETGVNNKLCILKAQQLLELSTREDKNSISIDSSFSVQNTRDQQPKFGKVSLDSHGVVYRRADASAPLSLEHPSLATISAPAPQRKIKSITLFYHNKLGWVDYVSTYEFDQVKNTCIPVDLVEVLAKPEFTKECSEYFNTKIKDDKKNYFSDPVHRINCNEMISTGSEELFLTQTQSASRVNAPQGTR